MNSQLVNRVYDVRPDILEFIKQQPVNTNVDRNKNLLETGKVTYGQLERIIHDMKFMDKKANPDVYNLYGGKLMEDWGKLMLKNDRDLVQGRKESKKVADDLTGDRKNAFNKTHTTSMTPKINVNDVSKQNSETFTNSSMFSGKALNLVHEEIIRIKKLME